MRRKAFFVDSKVKVFDYVTCDKCGKKIIRTEGGRDLKKCFWNPNPRANDKNICEFCHEVWQNKRAEGWLRWQEAHAALEHTANIPSGSAEEEPA